jgi:aspartyl-tRNA(Asn)/glutamyl-tRNA(Gln) amidotransferase subunit A
LTITEAAPALRARKISSKELTEEAFARIALQNGALNAYITVTEIDGRAAAAQADRNFSAGLDRGPLQGIPIALKDVFNTKGIRTTCGSLLFEHNVPQFDAAVTERLAEAGTVLTGKTGLHELAYGITSNNPHFGTIRNPHDPTRIPGGSSGGSAAAVASGMVPAAMGSDTGGSIRIPAAFCGLVGMKPTSGRVSRFGVKPLDFSLDHMGPLTRTVRDAALVLQAIAGHDERDDTSSRQPVDAYLPAEGASIAGLRIGRPENFYLDRLEPAVREAIDQAFRLAERLGAHIIPVTVPDIAAMNTVARVILMSEASALLEPYLDRRELFGSDVLALFDQGRALPATYYINAQRLRRQMQREYAKIWQFADVLFTPTSPIVAPAIGAGTVVIDGLEEDTRMAATRFVRSFNLLGWPALSLPCPVAGGCLPIGLQIIGPAFHEARILLIAAALEDCTVSSH